MEDFIKIRGAREHNLKNINLDLPRNKLIVLTGLSVSYTHLDVYKRQLPPSEKKNPLTASAEELAKILEGKELPGGLQQYIEGISPQTAIQLCEEYWPEKFPVSVPEAEAYGFALHIQMRIREILEHPMPCLQKDMNGKPVFFSAVPYACLLYTSQ